MSRTDVDVAIIGGGPAGSTTASYLAKAGLRCAVIEREIFPRPHVGEALVPAVTRVIKEIGFAEEMDNAGFCRRDGSAWTTKANRPVYYHGLQGLPTDCRADVRFGERPLPGVDRNYAWNVDRAKFDLLLLRHAHKLGAAVYEGCRVAAVDLSGPVAPRLRLAHGAKETTLSAKCIVDASGRQTVLGNQLRLKRNDPFFNQHAIHSWFEGFHPKTLGKTHGGQFHYFEEAHEGHTYNLMYFSPGSKTWMWLIPITDSITSVGVVTRKKDSSGFDAPTEKIFWDALRAQPELFDALRSSKQLRPLKAEGGHGYNMTRICGDGFLLVGDSAYFVDPIFSTGINTAMNGARLASQDILRAAVKGDFSRRSFRTYQTSLVRGMSHWYEFISLYYRLSVLFTFFVKNPRYHLELFKIIQGDLTGGGRPRVLSEMKRMLGLVERRKDHPWHGLLS